MRRKSVLFARDDSGLDHLRRGREEGKRLVKGDLDKQSTKSQDDLDAYIQSCKQYVNEQYVNEQYANELRRLDFTVNQRIAFKIAILNELNHSALYASMFKLNDVLDCGMRFVFFGGAVLALASVICPVLVIPLAVYCVVWNYFDAFGGTIAVSSAPKSDGAAKVFAILDIGALTQLVATTFCTQIGLCAGAGTFGFSVCMWVSFARSIYDLVQANKETNMSYLLNKWIGDYEKNKKVHNRDKILALARVLKKEGNLKVKCSL